MRSELRRAGHLRQVTVEPLGAEATAALLERTLGTAAPSLHRAVFDRTDGVPFFVNELGSALAAAAGSVRPGRAGAAEGREVPLPDSVRDAVLLRAAGLSDDARAAVTTAAVAGLTFDPELVTAVAGLAEWPDELLRRAIVDEAAAGRMAFRHALVRDAFYGEVPWTRRSALHRAVAGASAGDQAAPPAVAEHWARGRRPDQAREACWRRRRVLRGARVPRRRAGTRRALEPWPDEGDGRRGRRPPRGAHGAYAELAGDLADATMTWREVADARRQAGDLPVSARPTAGGRRLELQGRWQEALASRERPRSPSPRAGWGPRPPRNGWPRPRTSARPGASARRWTPADRGGAGPRSGAGRSAGAGPRQEGNVRARMGEGHAAVELVRAGLAMALEHGLTGPAAEIYQRLADALEHAGDYPAAKDTYDQAFSFCAANALEPTAQLCLACLTAVLRQSGDWDRAVALCRQVIASSAATLHARAVATGISARSSASAARPGGPGRCCSSRSPWPAGSSWPRWRYWRPGGWRSLTRPRERRVRGGPLPVDPRALAADRGPALRDRAAALGDDSSPSRDGAGARDRAAALAQIAADAGQDEAMSALAHALGETALLDGSPEQAADQFARALVLLQGVDMPFDRAESQRRAAAALAGIGRREEAVEHLVAAHRGSPAGRPAAGGTADRQPGRPGRTGRPAPRPARRCNGSNGGLTRREVEVVRLVAMGHTNREIARQLFLSPRTVEMHVGSILVKLDCRSRADAARKASELGLLSLSV